MTNRRILLLGVLVITGLSLTGAAFSGLQEECVVKNKAHPANYAALAARPHADDPYAHYIQEHKRHAQSGLQSLFNYKLDQFMPWQAQGPQGQSSENL